jgi:hypothetical protein
MLIVRRMELAVLENISGAASVINVVIVILAGIDFLPIYEELIDISKNVMLLLHEIIFLY